MRTWRLVCSACDEQRRGDELASTCSKCGQPFLVEYDGAAPRLRDLAARWDMWRYAPLMPLQEDELPVTLGEGATPLIDLPAAARLTGVRRVWIKEEGLNPTGSFKARGMSAAVTRARGFGCNGLVVPTAGNAGAALAADLDPSVLLVHGPPAAFPRFERADPTRGGEGQFFEQES